MNQIGKNSSIALRRLETENLDLRDLNSKLQKEWMELKLKCNQISSENKALQTELDHSKQTSEVLKCEYESKVAKVKFEASKDISRLECELDKSNIQLKGKFWIQLTFISVNYRLMNLNTEL